MLSSSFKFIVTVALLLAFLHHPVYSQSDTSSFNVAVNAAGTINNTNLGTTYIFNNAVNLSYNAKNVEINANNSWLYGRSNTNKITNDDYVSNWTINLNKSLKRFYYWGLASAVKSYSLRINSQYQGGVGASIYAINKPNTQVNISDGFVWESSDITVADTINQKYATIRNSFRLSMKFLFAHGLLSIKSMSFYQPSLLLADDYIIRSNNELGIHINKWLSFTTQVVYNRFNRTSKENLLFSYGVKLEKRF